jgi:hypothetical protein
MGVAPNFFFDGLPEPHLVTTAAPTRGPTHGFSEAHQSFGEDNSLGRRETLELVRGYYRITDPAARQRVQDLIKSLHGFAEAPELFVDDPRPVLSGSNVSPEPENSAAGETRLADALAKARARGVALKQHLLEQPDMLGASEFAAILGVSAQDVRLKQKRHEVLAVELAPRAVRYPTWQVLPDQRLLPGLPKLFDILGDDPWRMLRFLQQQHGETRGLRAVDALRRGDLAGVMAAAKNTAAGAYS